MKLVDRRVHIAAPPGRVYELLTDAALLAQWMAPVTAVDARPGGGISWTRAGPGRRGHRVLSRQQRTEAAVTV